MKKIASFRVNHNVLEPGVYVSRVDYDPVGNNPVTTFDIRMTCLLYTSPSPRDS